MAFMAERGSLVPMVITLGIAAVLFVWAMYAFSGAGVIRRLPCLRAALSMISAIYLLRAIAPVVIFWFAPQIVDSFLIWSSLICLLYGLSYAVGTKQVWRNFA